MQHYTGAVVPELPRHSPTYLDAVRIPSLLRDHILSLAILHQGFYGLQFLQSSTTPPLLLSLLQESSVEHHSCVAGYICAGTRLLLCVI